MEILHVVNRFAQARRAWLSYGRRRCIGLDGSDRELQDGTSSFARSASSRLVQGTLTLGVVIYEVAVIRVAASGTLRPRESVLVCARRVTIHGFTDHRSASAARCHSNFRIYLFLSRNWRLIRPGDGDPVAVRHADSTRRVGRLQSMAEARILRSIVRWTMKGDIHELEHGGGRADMA